jgi:hypothetical protein
VSDESGANAAHRRVLLDAGYGVMEPRHVARLRQLLAAAEAEFAATLEGRPSNVAAAYARIAAAVEGTLLGLDFGPGDDS